MQDLVGSAPRTTEVHAEVTALEDSLVDMESLLDKLSIVINSGTDEVVSSNLSPPAQTLCPLADRIRDSRYRIERFNRILRKVQL